MTAKEAIQAMLDGKKIRRPSWAEGDYFMFDGECFIAEDATVVIADFYGNDWEIYEEPKPKQVVVIEKWLIRDCLDIETVIEINAEQLDFFLPEANSKKVKLLDTYEVEL